HKGAEHDGYSDDPRVDLRVRWSLGGRHRSSLSSRKTPTEIAMLPRPTRKYGQTRFRAKYAKIAKKIKQNPDLQARPRRAYWPWFSLAILVSFARTHPFLTR